jgi:O-antigen ligase
MLLVGFDNTSDLEGRLEDSFSPLKYFDQAGFFGYGIGTAQIPMEPYLTKRWEMPGYWEEEGERIVIEVGLLGYCIIMLLRWSIAYACYRIYKRIRKLEYKILAIQMTAFQLPFLLNMQSNIFNYIDGLFYWIAIGFVYFAYVMDMKYKEKMDLQASTTLLQP